MSRVDVAEMKDVHAHAPSSNADLDDGPLLESIQALEEEAQWSLEESFLFVTFACFEVGD